MRCAAVGARGRARGGQGGGVGLVTLRQLDDGGRGVGAGGGGRAGARPHAHGCGVRLTGAVGARVRAESHTGRKELLAQLAAAVIRLAGQLFAHPLAHGAARARPGHCLATRAG